MSNLLLESTKSKLLWQRRIRLLLTISLIATVVMIVVYAALLPVAVYTYIMSKELPYVQTLSKEENLGKQRRELRVKLEERDAELTGVRLVYDQSGIIDVIRSVLDKMASLDGVVLTRVDVSYKEGAHVIYVVGAATDRDSVVKTRDILESVDKIVIIDFPVSNFALNEGEYNFVVSLGIEDIYKPLDYIKNLDE